MLLLAKVLLNKNVQLHLTEVKEEVKALFTEEELADDGDLVSKYFKKTNKEAVRNVTLDLGTRLDGRKTTEIRPYLV